MIPLEVMFVVDEKVTQMDNSTHRSVGAFLASVFASPAIHVHVDTVYDLKELLHDGHSLVAPIFVLADRILGNRHKTL